MTDSPARVEAGRFIFGGAYGDGGTGKTADAIFAFPDGLFIADKGALDSAQGLVGVDNFDRWLKEHWLDANNLETAREKLITIAKSKRHYSGVVVDDVSIHAQRTVLYAKAGKNKYELWDRILKMMLDIAHICRRGLNAHVWITAHEQAPKTMEGLGYVKGGIMVPGKSASHLPKAMDILFRAVREDARPSWPYAYQSNNSDPSYVTKDRTNTTADVAPMNLGEILRLSGRSVPRMKGLEWQDGVVASVAKYLLDIPPSVEGEDDTARAAQLKVLQRASTAIRGKYSTNSKHIAWALRDAVDRAVLIRTRNDPLRRLMGSFQ